MQVESEKQDSAIHLIPLTIIHVNSVDNRHCAKGLANY